MPNELGRRYDAIYSSDKREYGLGQPSKVVEDATKYISGGDALDLGAGKGRNTIYLASKGFKVTAVDLSKADLDHLRQSLKDKGQTAELILGDITKIEFNKNYDLIVSVATLFHLPPLEALTLFGNIQRHTTVGGLNAISTFTKESDFYRNEPDTNEYYPDTGELKNLYADWEILEYEEVPVNANDKRPDYAGSRVVNTAAIILARKLK